MQSCNWNTLDAAERRRVLTRPPGRAHNVSPPVPKSAPSVAALSDSCRSAACDHPLSAG